MNVSNVLPLTTAVASTMPMTCDNAAMPAPRFNFDTSARLVSVSIGVWTARKKDRYQTEKTEAGAGAQKGAASVYKDLLAGRPELKEIQQFAGQVKLWLYTSTMCWAEGQQLVPTVRLPKLSRELEVKRATFWQMVGSFLMQYEDMIAAQAFALGSMFDRREYPSVTDIRSRFHFDIDFSPVPSAGDWRVDLMDEAQRDLQASLATQMDATVQRRLDEAMADLRGTFGAHLKRMSEMLVEVKKTSTRGKDVGSEYVAVRGFKETLLTTAHQLIEDVAEMNLTGDPALEEARQALARAISGVEFTDLKTPAIMRDVKKDVDAILSKFDF